MVGAGSSIVGASVGVSAGGIGVSDGKGMGVLVGGTFVGSSVGVLVGIGVVVLVGVTVIVEADAADLCALTVGFVPQSTWVLRHLVTRVCKAEGSQALKKS